MPEYQAVGKSVPRKESWDKVTGRAEYIDDQEEIGTLHAVFVTSPYAHAYIEGMDIAEAKQIPGVQAIVTGRDMPMLVGSSIVDRPPLAFEKVRYFGEPVAMVIADTEAAARRGAFSVRTVYRELPVVHTPLQAYQPDSILVHERLGEYKVREEAKPEPGTNISNRTKVRKGSIQQGFAESDVIVEEYFSFPQSLHAAMETRCAEAEIKPSGEVWIASSSQAPFEIREQLSMDFGLDESKINVHVPLVGGAYGGKTHVQLEILAYIASKAVGGRRVKLRNSREEDSATSPTHIGLQAKVRLGCTREGKLKAAELLYLFDGGAYAERAVVVSKAAGLDCTGPYAIEHVWCDSLCLYTNHPYATAFRGFGHSEYTFVVERTMDILAKKLGVDPLEFRLQNAIAPGDTTPTQVVATRSNTGEPVQCLIQLKELMKWNEGQYQQISERKVRAKGIAFAWKNSTTPRDAGAGAVLTFTDEGNVSINCGAVEIGQGTKTVLTQMAAEVLGMNPDDVDIEMEVDTKTAPKHWKTAASRTTYLVGNAVVRAAADAVVQMKEAAAALLGVPAEELEVAGKRVYQRNRTEMGVKFSDIVQGFVKEDGTAVSPQIIGRGSYMMEGITEADPATGAGMHGPEWGIIAQGVEVEFDTRDCTYEIVRAVSVVDAGKILSYKGALGQVMGAMSMGLSFASREGHQYDEKGRILNTQFRSYKVLHYGEHPEYIVEFLEIPHDGTAFKSRALGEHGILGMPAALGNSLSVAAGVSLHHLPLTPELIWRTRGQERGRLL
ncbi:xanthine dehydrogenase family protein molybdopterin-binding subunit [Ectobacillus ponti]|uniref:Xanthine dehydrogenase family protein molybdopterin-binding subunit n=1 Tax=Ectobacillus ponti TaxID=2961894 RepID=A0AA42BQQ4_9BACI|nr:xanthine dehydrogenase family protein molybdopterin-binding subunit [Ectobacillus ponti]MCP8970525.1 xanthine dehydrogenase family protein molybdopterin-binding subunit [Ectobacillus ponti]